MKSTVYDRMFDRLSDLIGGLTKSPAGSTFYASPRQPDDMSLYCCITNVSGNFIDLEIAHDESVRGVPGETIPTPWMTFRLDLAEARAELLSIQENLSYELVHSESEKPNPRRAALNMFAVNWLSILINMQFVFVPVVAPDYTTA